MPSKQRRLTKDQRHYVNANIAYRFIADEMATMTDNSDEITVVCEVSSIRIMHPDLAGAMRLLHKGLKRLREHHKKGHVSFRCKQSFAAQDRDVCLVVTEIETW